MCIRLTIPYTHLCIYVHTYVRVKSAVNDKDNDNESIFRNSLLKWCKKLQVSPQLVSKLRGLQNFKFENLNRH